MKMCESILSELNVFDVGMNVEIVNDFFLQFNYLICYLITSNIVYFFLIIIFMFMSHIKK